MTHEEFRKAQAQLGLKNREVERLFDVSDQTVINWRHGHTRIPGAVQWALRAMVAANPRRLRPSADQRC